MTRPHLVRSALLVIALTLLATVSPAALDAEREPIASISPLRGTTTRYYTMKARVRPLLVWMTRDHVGGARVSWSETPTTRRVELLIGSDPERAPMGINRWGFISEQTSGGVARLLGLMTETDDTSIDKARSDPRAIGSQQAYRSLRSIVRDGDARTTVQRVVFDKDFSYRHYATLLDRLPPASLGREQRARLAPGTEPGFLLAVKALVRETADEWQRTGRAPATPIERDYVYMGRPFRLKLRAATLVKNAVVNTRGYGEALDGEFEIRNQSGGVTAFRMVYGLNGAHAEAPLRIVFRPRWWIELELLVTDPAAAPNAFAMKMAESPR